MQITKQLTSAAIMMIALAASAATSSAAIIGAQGFEGGVADTLSYTLSGTGGAISTANLATDFPGTSRVNSGTASFQHTSTNNTAQTSVLTFDPVTLPANDSGTQVTLHLAAISKTSNNGLDNADLIQVYIALDGGAFSTTADLTVEGFGNARWSYTSGNGVASVTVGVPVAKFQPIAGGDRTTDGYSTLILNLPDSASSFAMKVAATNNSTGEVWAIDDVALTTSSVVPEPTSIGLAAAGLTTLIRRRRA